MLNAMSTGAPVRRVFRGWGELQANSKTEIVDIQKNGQRGTTSKALKDHHLIANIRNKIEGNPDHDESDKWLAYRLFELWEGSGRVHSSESDHVDQRPERPSLG